MEVILIIIIIIIIIYLIVTFIIKSPEFKGKIGESRVAGQLEKLNNEEYKLLNNLIINTEKGSYQIDHVIVSIYGIFVIETKNYKGWIHGSENSEYWKKTFYKNKTRFRNPIKQNRAHIYALKSLFSNYKNIRYYPIVVFTSDAELKNVYTKTPVVYDYLITKTIVEKEKEKILSKEQIENITEKLIKFCSNNKNTKNNHIVQVQKKIYDRRKKERALICPKCGGQLIIRNGPYGRFYGCKNYPKCRYRKNIKF